MKKRNLIVFLFLTFLISCVPTSNTVIKTSMPITVQSNTDLAEPTQTITQVILTATQTKTKLPPTKTPTPTPVNWENILENYPTDEPEVYLQKYEEWVKSEENCEFPCLWGLQPGTSELAEAWETVHEVFQDKRCDYINEGESYCIFSNDPLTYEYSSIPFSGIMLYFDEEIITLISAYGGFREYSLRDVISEIKYPTDAYLFHYLGGEGWAESSLVLVYDDPPVIVEYYKGARMKSDNTIEFCLEETDYANFDLFPQNEVIDLTTAPFYKDLRFQRFSDLMGSDFETYYLDHKKPDGSLCIISQQDDWY